MNRTTRCLVGLASVAVVASGTALMPPTAPRELFDERRWAVESVMVLNEATTTTYLLDQPLRIVRDGRATVSRRQEGRSGPVVRVDLTIDGESVIVYSRLRQ